MTARDQPFDTGRVRPLVTSLDAMRPRLDLETVDAAIFGLSAVAADLGYGDIRPLPGSIAWIDRLRGEGKRIAVVSAGERLGSALDMAQIADRVDVVTGGLPLGELVPRALDELDISPDRAVGVGVDAADLQAARDAGIQFLIAIARGGGSTPDELRRAGATAVVADLQELLGPTSG